MKKLVFLSVFVLTIICTSSNVYAQKYGHVNLGNLLSQMPEIEASSAQLVTFQEQLQKALQLKIDSWEQRVVDLQNTVSEMTPNEVKQQEEKLLKEQQEILQEEQLLSNKVLEKRNEIMKPIIAKAQNAIDQIGKENGYTMIFDTSIPNLVLYVKESDDLMDQVLAKLGIAK
jgi:outer membrane protein